MKATIWLPPRQMERMDADTGSQEGGKDSWLWNGFAAHTHGGAAYGCFRENLLRTKEAFS